MLEKATQGAEIIGVQGLGNGQLCCTPVGHSVRVRKVPAQRLGQPPRSPRTPLVPAAGRRCQTSCGPVLSGLQDMRLPFITQTTTAWP
jgi:hypothetical protein